VVYPEWRECADKGKAMTFTRSMRTRPKRPVQGSVLPTGNAVCPMFEVRRSSDNAVDAGSGLGNCFDVTTLSLFKTRMIPVRRG
jgi:hypothetical protein